MTKASRSSGEALAGLGEAAEEAERAAAGELAGQPSSGSACANLATATPLGISTAPPSRCSTCTLRASALTAIRAVIFSRTSCSMPWAADRARERVIAVWKVATTGPRADSTASSDRLERERLVHVQHVERAPGQPAAHPGGRDRAERDPGHRPVVRQRHRPPGRDHVRRQVGVLVGRRQHADLVPEPDQRLGEVA